MSAILLDNGVIHYEVFGRGKPVVLLHGWLGSWRYWMPTMEALADTYRTYAMDFWGYGDSDKPGDCYGVDDYVRMVGDFLDGLGIAQASLIGHALGGVVALRVAVERPERVAKLALIDTPVHGSGLSSAMRAVRNPLSRLVAGPRALIGLWMRALKRVSGEWGDLYDDIAKDTEKLDQAAVQRSIESMLELDLRTGLKQLYTHTLVVYGDRDEFVSTDQAAFFTDGNMATAQVVILGGCRHFPFLDEPSKFNRLLKDFLGSELGQVVALKEEWKRRYKQTEFL
jgi:pimeloyl-ACP methyl ester carboxylesterase